MTAFVIASMIVAGGSLIIISCLWADHKIMRTEIGKLKCELAEANIRNNAKLVFPNSPRIPTEPAYFEGNATGLRTLH